MLGRFLHSNDSYECIDKGNVTDTRELETMPLEKTMAASSEPSLVAPLFIATSDVATPDNDVQFPMIQINNEERTTKIRFFQSVVREE